MEKVTGTCHDPFLTLTSLAEPPWENQAILRHCFQVQKLKNGKMEKFELMRKWNGTFPFQSLSPPFCFCKCKQGGF